MKHHCIVPGCNEEAPHAIKLRCMRVDTSAVWAPTTGAYLCDKHATEGAEIELIFRPKADGKIKVSTFSEYRKKQSEPVLKLAEIIQGPRRAA
jgi:hypothetical protein